MNEFKLPRIFNWELAHKKIKEPSYKVYTALLNQSGTDAPVPTVLENTIGNIWFTYDNVGVYYANSDGLFTIYKTHSLNDQTCGFSYGDQLYGLALNTTSGNEYQFQIITVDFSINPVNNALTNKLIEIRVYN